MTELSVSYFDIDSKVMEQPVPASVILPPGHSSSQETSYPLLIHLHGGGMDRTVLEDMIPQFEELYRLEQFKDVVVASFSSGPGSFYQDPWPEFIVEELPGVYAEKYCTRTDKNGLFLSGVSMGGFGTLRVGFSYPDRFGGIAALEPAIISNYEFGRDINRNNWWIQDAIPQIYGDDVDPSEISKTLPTSIARANAKRIRESGLPIYLECGDEDSLMLQDGAEFLHRVLWDHDVPHEYHLVRWGDHVGLSIHRRFVEAHTFLASARAGDRIEQRDLPLNEDELAYIKWSTEGMFKGEPQPDFRLPVHGERAATIARISMRSNMERVKDLPEMLRNYGVLPDTK